MYLFTFPLTTLCKIKSIITHPKLALTNLVSRRYIIKIYKTTLLLTILILIFSIISLFIGVIDIRDILNGNFEKLDILLISRIPRLLAIICTGIGMSVSGLIMQKLCMNKFVSPSTGATIASAQFGVLLSLIWFSGASLMQKTSIAFVTSIIGTWLFVYFIQRLKFKDIVLVPLIGIMFGNLISGVTNYFAYKYDLIQTLTATFVGDFSLIIRGRYEIVFLVVPLVIIAFIYANHFNIVGMGEDFAKNLGIKYNLVLFLGLAIAALITSSIVVTVGTISYIGLIIPNIVAMFRGDKIRTSMLDVGLSGAAFVLICDIIGRIVIFPYELPIDLIIGIVGSIIFISLMLKQINPNKVKKSKVGV